MERLVAKVAEGLAARIPTPKTKSEMERYITVDLVRQVLDDLGLSTINVVDLLCNNYSYMREGYEELRLHEDLNSFSDLDDLIYECLVYEVYFLMFDIRNLNRLWNLTHRR